MSSEDVLKTFKQNEVIEIGGQIKYPRFLTDYKTSKEYLLINKLK